VPSSSGGPSVQSITSEETQARRADPTSLRAAARSRFLPLFLLLRFLAIALVLAQLIRSIETFAAVTTMLLFSHVLGSFHAAEFGRTGLATTTFNLEDRA
jgi:hypothetical protein